MTRFQVTVRYGDRPVRYHTFTVQAGDVGEALTVAAEDLPADVRDAGDLVEIRPAAEPEERAFLGED